jgi:hypothetical protein
VGDSLRDLADTRRRIGSGIRREQVPAEPQPVRASKFVNPPPATAPAWFQDRQVETFLRAWAQGNKDRPDKPPAR